MDRSISCSTTSPPTLLVRADAGERIGAGHVMRCLSLGQAWRDAGGEVHFACAEITDSWRERLEQSGCRVASLETMVGSDNDAETTAQIARSLDARFLVLDGYRFSPRFISTLRSGGRRLLVIDDGARAGAYDCDWLLNQNLSAAAAPYRGKVHDAQLLLGPRFALLAESFALHRGGESATRQTPPSATRVLVTLGGADPPNATQRVIEALARVETNGTSAVVIVGGANPHLASLKRTLAELPVSAARRIELVADTRDMPRYMVEADLAVAAGGVTALELACLGVPTLLITIAENQREPSEAAERSGFAQLLGDHETLDAPSIARAIARLCGDAPRRETMSRRGRELVDGRGARRVVQAMRRPAIRLRRATSEDCYRWWAWRNEAQTRRVSFHSDEIPLATHEAWYRRSLADPLRRLLIVENASREAIGFVRFDLHRDSAEISLGLAPEHRGRGYGEAVIRLAASSALTAGTGETIVALVKEQNAASRRAFEQADFRVVERTDVKGETALRLAYP